MRKRQTRHPLLLAVLLTACASGGGAGTEADTVRQYTIAELLDNTRLRGASFAPDGDAILVSSDETGIFNAYAIPVDGSEPVPLTHSTTEAILVESYFPEDERFIYSRDQGGDELTHIYVHEPDGSRVDVTPGEGLKANFLGWADDDRSFFVSTNERDRRYFDVYEVAAERDYERRMIFKNEGGYEFEAISPDERYLALARSRTRTDTDVYLYDRETEALRHLTPHEGEVYYEAEAFDPDGRSLYLLTDQGSEFRYLVRHDLVSGDRETIVRPDWNVRYASLSETGRYLVVAINNDARTEVRVYEADGMRRLDLPDLPAGDISALTFSRDERTMAFYVSSSRLPSDLFVQDLGSGETRRLTHSLNPEIDPGDLVQGAVVRFRSYDGLEIPGILYTPHQARSGARLPALVWVHGGPGGQSRLSYRPLVQYLVNHGYVVYAINNRGSSGYGKTFFELDDRAHGDADLGDCVASKDMLVGTGHVDPERIGIIGGSYGGYMVLAALAFRPEEFAVGVDIFGVANWVRTLESIPSWWAARRDALYEELGDPRTDRDYLRSISPLFHAQNIRRPLIVLQGANDPRVHKVESDEIVAAVRANGVPVEYIVFEDEGHGFLKRANRERGYRAILEFLDTYLKGEAGEPARVAA